MLTLNQKISRIDNDIVQLVEFRPEGNGIMEIAADSFIKIDTSINRIRKNDLDYQPFITPESDISLNFLQVNTFDLSSDFVLSSRLTTIHEGVVHIDDTKQDTIQSTTNITLNGLNVNSIHIGDTHLIEAFALVDMSRTVLQTNIDTKQTKTDETNLTANRLNMASDLVVGGQMSIDGSFQINQVIHSTIQNEVILSSQLNIANQGFGPALKVSQYGSGASNHVALFNAGSEGDAMLIDSSGHINVYRQINLLSDFVVKEKKLNSILDGSFDELTYTADSMAMTIEHIEESFGAVSNQIDTDAHSVASLFETKQDNLTNIIVKSVEVNDLRVNGDFILDGSFNLKGPRGEMGPTGPQGEAGPSGRPPLSIHNFTGLDERTTTLFSARDPASTNRINNDNEWYGGVLAPNGKIYGMPFLSNHVLVIDPLTRTSTFIPARDTAGVNNGSEWWGGVLGRNGKIYGIPHYSNKVLVIDPETHNISFIFVGQGGWAGGVLHPNGKIYGIPSFSGKFLVIDTDTHDISFIPIENEIDGFSGGVLGANGKIYCIPGGWSPSHALIFDPVTNYIKIIGNMPGGNKERRWNGGVLAPNGNIYGIPYSSNLILIYDTKNDTVSFIDGRATPGSNNFGSWVGGILAPDGKIYFIPNHSTIILVFDPTNNTLDRSYPSGLGTRAFHGGVLAPNGKIYGIPMSSNTSIEISTGLPVYSPWMLEAYFNKY